MNAPLIDRRVMRQGAAVTILIAVPAAVLIRLLKSSDLAGQESNWWVIGVALVLAGFVAGGYRAALGSADLPLSHAAAGAALAFVLMVAGSAIAAAFGGTHLGRAFVFLVILLALLCISASVLGGYAAVRRADRRRR